MNETRHGHWPFADIAGYTSYVASTALSHSREMPGELVECIISCFKPLMTISKIKGDAIFAHALETNPQCSSTMLLVTFHLKPVNVNELAE